MGQHSVLSPLLKEFRTAWTAAGCRPVLPEAQAAALRDALETVLESPIEGALVDCGGEASVIMAEACLARRDPRRLLVFLTAKATAAEPAILSSLRKAGYPLDLVRVVAGPFSDTIPKTSTLRVALLSVVSDSGAELSSALGGIYPRVSQHGVLIASAPADLAAAWEAGRGLVQSRASGGAMPMVWTLGPETIGLAKSDPEVDSDIERYDYLPPGMTAPDLLGLFPSAEARNPWQVKWRYLRCEAPHRWRTDPRDRSGVVTGYASLEEAVCLHALARPYAGRRGLEIGSHFGWTAAHLVAAGLKLDCIDPAFHDPERLRQVKEALSRVPGDGSFRLWAGFSPDLVPEARAAGAAPWSFAFIDGSHDGDGPRTDALAVLPHLDRDATVVFHDLTSPFVERGLYVMRAAGFNVRLFNTMQILGVAWRGNARILEHVADPNVPRIYHPHLAKYRE